MRSVVIGASGLVGSALMRILGDRAVGTYRTRPRPGLVPLDAADEAAVRGLVSSRDPEVIFFPAADPNVEWCELHPDEARERNVAPLLSTLKAAAGRRVLGFSSDYVFDGSAGPYDETDRPRPISVYGRIKLEIEEILLREGQAVIRTTTVFGREAPPPKNFGLRLIASLRAGNEVRVPSDQWSTPTYADDLAAAATRVAAGDRGLWHIAGPELMSRIDLARLVAEVFDLPGDLIRPVPTSELGQAAARPLRGGLRCERLERAFGRSVRSPRDALMDLREKARL